MREEGRRGMIGLLANNFLKSPGLTKASLVLLCKPITRGSLP